MTSTQNRSSAFSLTGVAPITVYKGSKDYVDADLNKARTVSNITISQYNSSNLLNSDFNINFNPSVFTISNLTSVPNLESITLINNENYIDSSGKTKSRVVFKVTNPDMQKIADVDIRHSLASSESGI